MTAAARGQGDAGGPAAGVGQAHGPGAAVVRRRLARDQAARGEAVDEADRARLRQPEPVAQRLERGAVGVVAQRDERHRVAPRHGGVAAQGGVGALRHRVRERAQQVRRAGVVAAHVVPAGGTGAVFGVRHSLRIT